MRVLQLNLQHCEAAQDLLQQTVRELKIDLAVLSEGSRSPTDTWTHNSGCPMEVGEPQSGPAESFHFRRLQTRLSAAL